MAEFLTTKSMAAKIEEIIRCADTEIVLLTPYLQLSDDFAMRLKEADDRGVKITLVFRKDNLKPEERPFLTALKNLLLLDVPNLHAKCYYNSEQLVIGSMNLYEASERKNREMGIYLRKQTDEELFRLAVRESESIMASGTEPEWHVRENSAQQTSQSIRRETNDELDFAQSLGARFCGKLLSLLKERYPDVSFGVGPSLIFNRDFLMPGLYLGLEDRGSRFRIDFRLPGDWRTRYMLYDRLYDEGSTIERMVGHPIDWGNQMKRLKLEIAGFAEKARTEWTEEDALQVFGVLCRLEEVVIPRIKAALKE